MVSQEQRKKLKPVPTVYPTSEQFAEPILYLSSPEIQVLCEKYGMIKVRPPAEWKPPFLIDTAKFRFRPRVQQLSELGLRNRIRFTFKDGLVNFLKMKKKKIPRTPYIVLLNGSKMYYYDLFLAINKYVSANYEALDECRQRNDTNGRNTVYNELRTVLSFWNVMNERYGLDSGSNEVLDFYLEHMKDYCIFLAKKYSTKIAEFDSGYMFNQNPYNESDDSLSEDESEDEYWCHVCGLDSDDEHTLICDGCNKGYHTYCLKPALKSVPKASWFCEECLVGTGEYGFVTSNTPYLIEEFQQLNDEFKEKYFRNMGEKGERCKELSKLYLTDPSCEEEYVDTLETEFWENLVENDESRIRVNYGADIHNLEPGQILGFPMNYPYKEELAKDYYMNHSFNLTKLPFAKGSLLNHLNDRISGMTIPWLYIGLLFSTFCWHLEDHYMLSANYCHFGDIKKWYCIPSSSCGAFEHLMKELAPDLFLRQPDLLHQLVTQLLPYEIVDAGVECYYANQKPGEFVVTFPQCYHAGFNCGFNVNEAVNFLNSDWLKYGILALEDYKRVRKPPVFNQVQLCYSILHHFLGEELGERVLPGGLITKEDFELLVLCIAYLEKSSSEFSKDFNDLTNIFGGIYRLKELDVQYREGPFVSEKRFDITKVLNLDLFYLDSADKEKNGKSSTNGNDPDEVVCSTCREICCMGYVELYTRRKVSVQPEPVSHLATPEPSPQGNKRKLNSSKNRSKMRVIVEKDNIQTFCLHHFNDYFKLHKLKKTQDFTVWVIMDEDGVARINADAKMKLRNLRIKA